MYEENAENRRSAGFFRTRYTVLQRTVFMKIYCKNTAFILSAIMLSTPLSGCKEISENTPFTETVITPSAVTNETVSEPLPTEENVSIGSESPSEPVFSAETTVICETSAEETVSADETTAKVETVTTHDTTSATPITTTEKITETEKSAATSTIPTTSVTEAVTTVSTEASAAAYYGSNSYSVLNYREQKGIWISFLEYGSIMKNKSANSFRKSIGDYFDNILSIGFNTVYVHARAYGDAYYKSALFPSGDRFNGEMGTSDNYDALQIMIEEAHSRGLSIHAWINPMRLMTDSQIQSISDKYTVKKWYNDSDKKGTYIVKCDDRWYLNPAYPEVRQLICDGVSEIVSAYDVDGIQIDDYFYPTQDTSFDSAAFSASGTSLSLAQWRTENVNAMVTGIYKAIRKANPDVVFGISPQGSIVNNRDKLYADVESWCRGGYCDYILPQIYFGFENAALPFDSTAKEWNRLVSGSGVKLVIGLAGYKIGAADSYAGDSGKNEWMNNSDIISRQMITAAALDNYGGTAIFRYASIFEPSAEVSAQVSKELENIPK